MSFSESLLRFKFILLQLLLSFNLIAQDSKDQKRNSYFVLPVLFYLPETKLGFGGAANYSFRLKNQENSVKPSSLTLGFAYTLEKQFLSYLPFNLYFNQERYWLKGELGYYDYIYPYFGIGNDERIPEEKYSARYPRIKLDALYEVFDEAYIGINFRFDDYQIKKFAVGGELENEEITGKSGGATLGIGPILILDERDQINYPSKGVYTELRSYFNLKSIGATYDFTRIDLLFSKYLSLKSNVLALNAYLSFSSGEVPFYELSLFGGSKRSRGYLEGSYRDNNMYGLQLEYRFNIWKRFGGVVFANGGGIYRKFSTLKLDDFLPATGAGLRFMIDKSQKINLRLDVGFGKNSTEYYFTFGEAF